MVLTGPITPVPEPGGPELLHQLTAELGAEGFDVVIESSTHDARDEELETVAVRGGAVAAVRIESHGNVRRCSVWLARPGARGTLRALESRGDENVRTLALRVVELVRASSIELELEASQRTPMRVTAPKPALRVSPPKSPASPQPRRLLGAVFGASLWLHPGGLRGSVAPALGLMLRFSDRAWLELRGVGPALSRESSERGIAEIDQELLLVGLRFDALNAERVGLHWSAAAGGYRLGARGNAEPPFTDGRDARVVGAAGFGGGLRCALVRSGELRLALSARGDAFYLLPRPVLRFAERSVASAGQPALLATAGMDVTW